MAFTLFSLSAAQNAGVFNQGDGFYSLDFIQVYLTNQCLILIRNLGCDSLTRVFCQQKKKEEFLGGFMEQNPMEDEIKTKQREL